MLNATAHSIFLELQKLIYQPCGLLVANYKQETENKEYGACSFYLNNYAVQFRVAKITPTKNGQFVAFYTRTRLGTTIPYDSADTFDFIIIACQQEEHLGQFIFPKAILVQNGYVSVNGIGGKRAMRIYPPWDVPASAQAAKTQAWQLPYFTTIKPHCDNTAICALLVHR